MEEAVIFGTLYEWAKHAECEVFKVTFPKAKEMLILYFCFAGSDK